MRNVAAPATRSGPAPEGFADASAPASRKNADFESLAAAAEALAGALATTDRGRPDVVAAVNTDGLEGLVSMLGVKWTTARDVAGDDFVAGAHVGDAPGERFDAAAMKRAAEP